MGAPDFTTFTQTHIHCRLYCSSNNRSTNMSTASLSRAFLRPSRRLFAVPVRTLTTTSIRWPQDLPNTPELEVGELEGAKFKIEPEKRLLHPPLRTLRRRTQQSRRAVPARPILAMPRTLSSESLLAESGPRRLETTGLHTGPYPLGGGTARSWGCSGSM